MGAGAELDKASKSGHTPLMRGAQSGSTEAVQLLLEQGAAWGMTKMAASRHGSPTGDLPCRLACCQPRPATASVRADWVRCACRIVVGAPEEEEADGLPD